MVTQLVAREVKIATLFDRIYQGRDALPEFRRGGLAMVVVVEALPDWGEPV